MYRASPRSHRWPALLLLLTVLSLSACSGGGTDGSPGEGLIPEDRQDGDGDGGGGGGGRELGPYQWGLEAIGAYDAYERLRRTEGPSVQPGGAGVVVGMIDSGIDKDHPLFGGKDITEVITPGTVDETGERRSHGTAVASVIGGARPEAFQDRAHGVAWGTDLAVFTIRLRSFEYPNTTGIEDEIYTPVTLQQLREHLPFTTPAYESALQWRNSDNERIDFLTLGFDFRGIIDDYSAADLRANYGDVIDLLEQDGIIDKTILVSGGGNWNGYPCVPGTDRCVGGLWQGGEVVRAGRVDASSVGVRAGLVARFPGLQGHSVVVVAIGPNGTIADFSNRCGIAAPWCIAAPGVRMRAAYFGPYREFVDTPSDKTSGVIRGMYVASGTSLAAAMVTGGLAVMKHLFRSQLSNTELLARLLTTANGDGIYANSAVYGQGLMDIDAATSPLGSTLIANGGRVADGGSPMQVSHVGLGGALGDGLAHEFAGHEIAAFDELGAPFWFDLGDFASLQTTPAVEERLRGFMAPAPGEHPLGTWPHALSPRPEASEPGDRQGGSNRLQLGFLSTPSGAEPGLLGLADRAMTLSLRGSDALTVTAFSSLGVDGLEPVLGGALAWRPNGSRLGLRAGFLSEREAMLGTSARGAFGRLTANAAFAGLERQAQLRSWRVAAATEFGVVRARPEAGLFTGLSPLTTSAFALGATRPLGADTSFRLSLSQPLRVEAGHATLSVPAGRTRQGAVVRRALRAGLAPSGRQLDVAARWSWRPRARGELRLGAAWSHEPGHRAGADPALTLLGGWRHAF